MDIRCNGISGIIAWLSVIALFWFALCLPRPKTWKIGKIAALMAFSYFAFIYMFR